VVLFRKFFLIPGSVLSCGLWVFRLAVAVAGWVMVHSYQLTVVNSRWLLWVLGCGLRIGSRLWVVSSRLLLWVVGSRLLLRVAGCGLWVPVAGWVSVLSCEFVVYGLWFGVCGLGKGNFEGWIYKILIC